MKYPLFLDLTDQPVVVVGAGKVATRKIRTLVQAGARVTVISPAASAVIRKMKRVRWIRRPYRRSDLRGASLVVASTDDLSVNKAVCVEARRSNLLVNCVAPPSAGNFIVPSLVRRGGIALAISTDGASPAFAKLLRRDLERFLARGYPAKLKQMAKTRRK